MLNQFQNKTILMHFQLLSRTTEKKSLFSEISQLNVKKPSQNI